MIMKATKNNTMFKQNITATFRMFDDCNYNVYKLGKLICKVRNNINYWVK